MCVEAVDSLLHDKDSNILPDNGAVLADNIITNSDTRDSIKFIVTQEEIIAAVAKVVAEQILDIGRFIKFISNGWYKLKTTNK